MRRVGGTLYKAVVTTKIRLRLDCFTTYCKKLTRQFDDWTTIFCSHLRLDDNVSIVLTTTSETAARPTDNECSSVGRTLLSDTSVGDERTVVSQVTRGVAGQGPVDEGCYLKHDLLLHRK